MVNGVQFKKIMKLKIYLLFLSLKLLSHVVCGQMDKMQFCRGRRDL